MFPLPQHSSLLIQKPRPQVAETSTFRQRAAEDLPCSPHFSHRVLVLHATRLDPQYRLDHHEFCSSGKAHGSKDPRSDPADVRNPYSRFLQPEQRNQGRGLSKPVLSPDPPCLQKCSSMPAQGAKQSATCWQKIQLIPMQSQPPRGHG